MSEHAQRLTNLSLDAEQALLGAALVDPTVIDRVQTMFDTSDLCDPYHARIWTTMLALRGRGDGHVSVAMLAGALDDGEEGGGINVPAYISTLCRSAVSTVGAADYAREVRNLANKRRLMAVVEPLAALAGDIDTTSTAFLQRVEQDLLSAIKTDRPARQGRHMQEAVGDWIDGVLRRAEGDEPLGAPTGLTELDGTIGGLQPGLLYIVGGRPSMGKSAIMCGMARAAAAAGYGSHIASLEMDDELLAARLACDVLYDSHRVIYRDAHAGKVSQGDVQALRRAHETVKALPIRVRDQGGLTAEQVGQDAVRTRQYLEARGQRLGVVFIDYLQIMQLPQGRNTSRNEGIGAACAYLKQLAKDLGVAVVLLSQLNRAVENREDKRPLLSDLRDSGTIEQDADVIMFLYREDYYLERSEPNPYDYSDEGRQDRADWEASMQNARGQFEIIIAKQRQGSTGTVRVRHDLAAGAIRDRDSGGGPIHSMHGDTR